MLHIKEKLLIQKIIWLSVEKVRFWKKKCKMTDSISSTPNSQYFFTKISQIGPWVRGINWCQWHQCGSTYIVVWLSDISSISCKKCIFSVFFMKLNICRMILQCYLCKTHSIWSGLTKTTIFVAKKCICSKVSLLGVDSLWDDCTFIPADWG